MAKTWKCEICQKPVSGLGGYVQMTVAKHIHIGCYDVWYEDLVRKKIKNEEAAAKTAEQEREEIQAREDFNRLPRCPKCGVRMANALSLRYEQWGEVRLTGGAEGRCQRCTQEEVQARARARQSQPALTAQEAIRTAPTRPQGPSTPLPKAPELDKKPSQDEELLRKARESGNPTIEID